MAESSNQRMSNMFAALGLVLLIVATEYLARHYALYWLPVLGSLRTNDMLVSGAGYAALVWLTLPSGRRSLADIRRALGEIWAFIRDRQVQFAAALALGTGWLMYLDRFLWGRVELPFLLSPWRSGVTLFEPIGLLLAGISLLLVNGAVVPLAEEWLWRGLIQPRLAGVMGFIPGLLVTSVLFSLKHAVIDASLGRLLMLVGFGVVMGVTASRLGWKASALAHALANTIATILGLLLSGGQL